MRNKITCMLAMIITLLMLLSPIEASADQLFFDSTAYSKYVSVGSEFIYSVNVGKHYPHKFNGVVTFDNSILEVVKVESVYVGDDDVTSGEQGTITYSVSGNQLIIDFNPAKQENVLVTFKVKGYPSDGATTVKVKSIDNRWVGEPSDTMTVIKPSECPGCPTCEKDETECPVCEKCEAVKEEKNENKNNDTDNNKDNILLYSALGACGVLSIAVLVLAFRKNK